MGLRSVDVALGFPARTTAEGICGVVIVTGRGAVQVLGVPVAAERVELAQQHERLASCLEELEPLHSAAIRAAFLDGATYEELAQRMSVPLSTIKSWIRRGLLKLRACLEG
jgi:RNA polymerase sigma-70 factor (ECF subfamily)